MSHTSQNTPGGYSPQQLLLVLIWSRHSGLCKVHLYLSTMTLHTLTANCFIYFVAWPMSHVLQYKRKALWPVLLSITRGSSECFGFTLVKHLFSPWIYLGTRSVCQLADSSGSQANFTPGSQRSFVALVFLQNNLFSCRELLENITLISVC